MNRHEFLTADHSGDAELSARAISEEKFEDAGHALEWAMQQ